MNKIILPLLLCFFVSVLHPVASDEPINYKSTWQSVTQYPVPEWFRDAKFGIYCHWGIYSVPAYETEWYSHYMYVKDHPINKHHIKTYGALSGFGYKDFIPKFTAEKWNPDEWAELFQKAGARYAGLAVEHADGFAMWDSKLTEWDAADMGPRRDLVGDLAKSIKAHGMKFVATYHRQWLYAWYPTLDETTDASNPAYQGLYGPPVPTSAFVSAREFPDPLPDYEFSQEWLDRIKEVVDLYEPDMVWFDNKLDILHEKYRLDFLSYYYNKSVEWNKNVAATYKFEEFYPGAGILDLERSRMSEGKELPWLMDDSIDWKSWCYISDPHYKTPNRLVDTLVDVVSKNGCLLLNIGPRPDGTIPQEAKGILVAIGKWLDVNGEAIYDTRPWTIYGEGPTQVVEGHLSENKNKPFTSEDIRFTHKKDVIYAVALEWPENGVLKIKSLNSTNELIATIKSIEMLGSKSKLKWTQNKESLAIQLPSEKPCDYAYVLKINE